MILILIKGGNEYVSRMSQATQPPVLPPPEPLVKRPRLISSGGVLGNEWRLVGVTQLVRLELLG
ncbi:hypothetical protein [Vulcanisaeta distributa]|uniref:hypothetical protein n=1 Tax=Vulcanisaeta distributa TaxID=164451 RepID=UPI000A5BF7E6|nr:hypothetical protein [Vulcanisaeta distributa]